MASRAGVAAGAQVERAAVNCYSVVFTEQAGRVGFEMFLLQGEMRRPEQIEQDLSRALERVRRGDLFHAGKGDGNGSY